MNTYNQRYLNRTYLWIYFLFVLIILLSTSCNQSSQTQVLQSSAFEVPDHTETLLSVDQNVPSQNLGKPLKEL